MQDPTRPAADDYARALLLRLVPTGYRLIDAGDPRFAGVRQDFIRLAFKHIGPLGTYRALRLGSSEPDLRPAGLNGQFAIVVG